MPPERYNTITISEDAFALLTEVVEVYDYESIADVVETTLVIALDYDEAELAQLLADRLRE